VLGRAAAFHATGGEIPSTPWDLRIRPIRLMRSRFNAAQQASSSSSSDARGRARGSAGAGGADRLLPWWAKIDGGGGGDPTRASL
jgi:hypothetical protein